MASSSARSFVVIVAATAGSLGIGKNGALPWKLASDMAYFKRVTLDCPANKANAVIMGRKTWQSIPVSFRPLAGRLNVVLSRNPEARQALHLPNVLVATSLGEALDMLSEDPHNTGIDKVFVIGGGDIYREAITSDLCRGILVTSIRSDKFDDCDTFFPAINPDIYRLVKSGEPQENGGVEFSFDEYERIKGKDKEADFTTTVGLTARAAVENPVGAGTNRFSVADIENGGLGSCSESHPPVSSRSTKKALTEENLNGDITVEASEEGTEHDGDEESNEEEMQYLRLVKEIIEMGSRRGDRTGTGTLSKFGVQMRFNLRKGKFPLLTTKRVFWRGVAEELLWFVSGCTNANMLRERGIHIWDGNGSREFLDGLGFTEREEGDLGPVYGFQWRHFGAEYVDMHTDYTGKGVDQLAECIHEIKNNPNNRRIVLSAWNPCDLGKMALPPCHMFCQFYVADGELSCQMYQRSADMGLGVPFNIASYALLTRMVAQVCGLRVGDFVHTIGDAHVYLNHVDALRDQLKRVPRQFPTLEINPAKTDIDSFTYKDFEIKGYMPHKSIKMKMAV